MAHADELEPRDAALGRGLRELAMLLASVGE
jgi:hypothetical protein